MQGNMTNMTGQNKVIEQLWYTWSDVGIDTIRTGFRIRAASEGLFDPVSERAPRPELLQRLSPYQRYSLPKNADRSVAPNSAPVCLALINTGQERILVYKVYTGKDGIGRFGAFFTHLLVNLPEEFSVIDAISLWRSRFWQQSDATLENRKSTLLARISLEFLRQQQTKKTVDSQTIKRYLPYVIQAYLTKNLKTDSPQAQQKLYIAAPDEVVAQLISGLIHCLPIQLVKDLTFSTYEYDVTEATTEIVGTCWLSVAELKNDPRLTQLLPNHYYEEKLALNCYTGKHTRLVDHPRIAQYVQAAVNHFLTGTPEFQELLETVTPENYPNLTVDTLLQLFEMIVVRPQTPSQSDIETALTARTSSEYTISARLLSRTNYQHALLSLALNVPGWWATYKKVLINLRQHSTEVPLLARVLTALARRALLPHIVDIARNETAFLVKAASPREVSPRNKAMFQTIVDVMYCAAPPEAEPDVWRSLLKELLAIKHLALFFQYHWSSYAYLLKTWSSALSPENTEDQKLISDLLTLTLSWVTFGEFLVLRLPLDWTEMGTKKLIFQPAEPDAEKVSYLAQKYHPYIEDLLRQLADDPQRWSTATALFETLIRGKNQHKMSLLFLLLDSPMGQEERNVNLLLQRARLTVSEKGVFLLQHGERYLALYPQSPILSNYVQDFLEYLRYADIAIFRKSPSPEEPSPSESFLGFLTHHAPPSVLPERVSDWYSVARFVRQPSLLRTEWQYIAPGIGHLVNTSQPISMRPNLMKELALACIANEDEVTFMLNLLLNRLNILTRPVQEELLYRVAESARESISQGHSTKTLLVPCIQYALGFKLYQQEARQDMFIETFMKTLNLDEKTRNWLNTQAKRWSPDTYAAWKRLLVHQSSLAPPTFFERTAAFRHMRRALKHKSVEQREEGSDI